VGGGAPTEPVLMRDSSSAVLDTGVHDDDPLLLWNKAMDKYNVLEKLEAKVNAGGSDHCARSKLKLEQDLALVQAVEALRKLHEAKAMKKLEQYQLWLDGGDPKGDDDKKKTLQVPHSATLMNSFSADFWVYCFTDLFYRGDFRETKSLGLRKWARLLLRRRDFLGWTSSKEFVATAYNVCIRRWESNTVTPADLGAPGQGFGGRMAFGFCRGEDQRKWEGAGEGRTMSGGPIGCG